MPTFELLRVSLARKSDLPLFEDNQVPVQEPTTRKEFLKDALTERHDFTYRRRAYVYDPFTSDDDSFTGGISRKEVLWQNQGPDKDYAVVETEEWPLAYVLFDAASDSQVAAVQRVQRVGSPRALLLALMQSITRDPKFSMWNPYVEYITSQQDFWRVARENLGSITSIKFVFIPPNALQASEAVDDLVRAASEQSNAESTEVKITNSEGKIKPDSELVQASVDTASRGGGQIEMKWGRKTIFSSAKSRKTEIIANEDLPEPKQNEKISFLAKILLGRKS